MKLQDIDNLQKYVDEIKLISDKLDYNTSSAINKCITKITPLIKEERNRLESSNYIGLLWLIKLKMSRVLGKDVETLADIRRVLRR